MEAGAKLTSRLPGMTLNVGKEGHLEVCRTGPVDEEDRSAIMPQWCCPLRRQQTGRFESGSDEDNSGPNSDTPKTAKRRVAQPRRIAVSILPESRGSFARGQGVAKAQAERWLGNTPPLVIQSASLLQ